MPPTRQYNSADEAAKHSNGLGAVLLENGKWAPANNGDSHAKDIIGATLNNRVAQAGLDLDKQCGGEGCSTEQLKQIAEERKLEERRVSEAVSDGYGWVMSNPANSYIGGGFVSNSNSGTRYDLTSLM